MNKNEINKIKKGGEQEAIKKKIGGLLWDVKQASEKANQDFPDNFSIEIRKIEKFVIDLKDLFGELN